MKERHDGIVIYVEKRGFATAEELAKHLNVSAITIRRDLQQLAHQGRIQKVHGGAVPAARGADGVMTFSLRIEANIKEKRAIARYAAGLVGPREKLFLDAGSSCYYLAEALSENLDLLVITHSLDNYNVLRSKPGIKIIGLGGEYEGKLNAFVGPLAEEQISAFRADRAFLGAMSIDVEKGTCDDTSVERAVKNHMNTNSKESYILADSSKFRRLSVFNSIRLSDMMTVITSTLAPRNKIESLMSNGIKVIAVEVAAAGIP